jgi:hypothetical protein
MQTLPSSRGTSPDLGIQHDAVHCMQWRGVVLSVVRFQTVSQPSLPDTSLTIVPVFLCKCFILES